MKFYLAGPVGYGAEGTRWKDGMKKILREKGHEVYDPIENDHKYPLVPRMNKLKLEPEKHSEEIRLIMQEIFRDDCKFITDCDYLICFFRGRSLGTAGEQTLAYYLNHFLSKPIKTISIFDKFFTPDEWIICCSDLIFFDIKSCEKYLRKEIKDETLCYPSRVSLQCEL